MPEQTQPITHVQVHYLCDQCKTGHMIGNSSFALMSYPVQFPHTCNHCGYHQTFTKCYPCVEIR